MYEVEYSRDALKALKAMPRNASGTIRSKLAALAADPFASNNNVIRLQGSDAYRLRVGDWRVIYGVHDGVLTIEVLKIRPRGGAYQ